MKRIVIVILIVMFCVFWARPAFAASSDEDTMFAKKKIIEEIQSDIPSAEIDSWTEHADSDMDLRYVVPAYTTIGVNDNSSTLKDTLVFTEGYNIPVIVGDECVGTLNVIKKDGRWTVNSYSIGLDLKTAVEQRLNSSWIFIEIPQLGNDYGFLMLDGDGENYESISSEGSHTSNENSDSILQQIKENHGGDDAAKDHSMAKAGNNNFLKVLVIGLGFCISYATIYFLRKNKTGQNNL